MYSEKHFSSKIMLKMWLVPDLPLFFKKDSCEVKASSQHLDTWTLGQLDWAYHKSKICNISECWSSDIRVCDVKHFETLVFSSSHFLHNQKSQDKNLNILRRKRDILTGNKTHFSSFLKGFLLKQIKATFLEYESSFLRMNFLINDQLL